MKHFAQQFELGMDVDPKPAPFEFLKPLAAEILARRYKAGKRFRYHFTSDGQTFRRNKAGQLRKIC